MSHLYKDSSLSPVHPLVNVDFSSNIARCKSSEVMIKICKDFDDKVKKYTADYFFFKSKIYKSLKVRRLNETFILFSCAVFRLTFKKDVKIIFRCNIWTTIKMRMILKTKQKR